MLEIKDLWASVGSRQILKGICLRMAPGEIHAIMGPNGSGKSTLAKVVAGHPGYIVEQGSILFCGENLLTMEPDERARRGLFMGFQYPVEVPGVSNLSLLYKACNERRKELGERELFLEEFLPKLEQRMALMEIPPEMKDRHVNQGFSGGEKKRNEILQMAVLDPDLAILDETDSGLDIDSLRVVSRGINTLMGELRPRGPRSLLLITHYQRLLEGIKPHLVHVMIDGVVVLSGPAVLALDLEKRGYSWLKTKFS